MKQVWMRRAFGRYLKVHFNKKKKRGQICMAQALETINLSKRYGQKWALRDCNLQVPLGHVIGLVGPNGAGKSTLLNLSMGLLTPSLGSIKVLGYEPQKYMQQVLETVGFVAQDHPLYKDFSAQ